MRMIVMLRKPGVAHTQSIGQPDQVSQLVKDHRRRLVSRSFKMVGQTDFKQMHDRCPFPAERPPRVVESR